MIPDYKMACRQTVTLYNVYKDDTGTHYHRTAFVASAHLGAKRSYTDTKTGVTADTTALLVIPASVGGYVDPTEFDALPDKTGRWTLRRGDKACHGTGKNMTTDTWRSFIPANNPDILVVETVSVLRGLSDAIVHIEGGA